MTSLCRTGLLQRRTRQQTRCQSQQLKTRADATVRFTLQRKVNFGEVHKLVGDHPQLGQWSVEAAPSLVWAEGDVWSLDLNLDQAARLEFKIIKVAEGGHVEWEECDNHVLDANSSMAVGLCWGESHLDVTPQEGDAGGSDGGGQQHADPPQGQEATQQGSSEEPQAGGSSSRPRGGAGEEASAGSQWQGRDIVWMRSNQHSRERSGRWETEGLEGAARAIVAGDQKAGSWLDKLELVRKLVVEQAGTGLPSTDVLAATFVYLQLISTGAIECVESGGHYRPNKHAQIAMDVFRQLERVIGDRAASPADVLLARKAQLKLPSFTEQFTASTPLTRIRDIAHRNDIPHELKQEIKHTIQNKLHRNAGPEDLVATEALLARCRAEGGHPPAFLAELETFVAELRDFFNAGTFADLLAAAKPALDKSGAQAVDAFLTAKQAVDDAGQPTADQLLDAMHRLTTVRALLLDGLSSGLRNDVSEKALAMRQRWRLAEIRAEDYFFVLLSRFINLVDRQGGAEALAGSSAAWGQPLGGVLLGVRQLGLAAWAPAECAALDNELRAWQQAGRLTEREPALRLKATLQRVQRLAQAYTDALLEVLPARAAAIGGGLGLADERVKVFTEAEVRASVVFQLSKLTSLLVKAAGIVTGTGAWDPMVTGVAVGRLVEVEELAPGAVRGEDASGPLVLLVRRASGDEEVGAADVDLRGVVLAHGLPHLSHLGVRARQEKVVFAICEDEDTLAGEVRPLLGSQVELRATADGVSLRAAPQGAHSPASNGASPAANGARPVRQPAAVDRGKALQVQRGAVWLVPLDEATAATCGAKAAACGELARLAAARGAPFRAPTGVCLPYGSLEAAAEAAGQGRKLADLVARVEEAAPGGGLEEACKRLQDLVAGLRPRYAMLRAAGEVFEAGDTVIVRSSANVEDLEGMSGAGLYDSLANVDPASPTALGAAVAGVWASLYTRRAVLSRRAAGVAQADAAMAVLIQQQLAPAVSFVLHTVSPLDGDKGVLVAELAPGLGETLASATTGSPWRLAVRKDSGEVRTLAFANFSKALETQNMKVAVPAGAGGSASPSTAPDAERVVDYSREPLSTSEEERAKVGALLAKVGAALEAAFDGPQDVEGCLLPGGQVAVVQTRPQP